MDTIKVTVKRIVYSKDSRGGKWYVLGTDLGNSTGIIGWDVKEGEQLKLTGIWGVNKFQSKEFQFKKAVPYVPEDKRSLFDYICSRTKGIGDVMAEAIWQAVGEDFENLEIGTVPRLRAEIVAAFHEQRMEVARNAEQYKVMSWLCSKGATDKLAEAAWSKWEETTIPRVMSNVYILTELSGYGFSHVDNMIAPSFGIGQSDPRRINAGLLYAVKQLKADGSTAADAEDFLGKAVEVLKIDRPAFFPTAAEMIKAGQIVMIDNGDGMHYVSTAEDYQNECNILEFAKCN